MSRDDVTEAVLSAPFNLFLGALFGLIVVFGVKLFFAGYTTISGIVLACCTIAAFWYWFSSVLDRGVDRIAKNIEAQDAKDRGVPLHTPEEIYLGEVHWFLRHSIWIGIAAGLLLGAIFDPRTLLGMI
jgi:hypothetical protein